MLTGLACTRDVSPPLPPPPLLQVTETLTLAFPAAQDRVCLNFASYVPVPLQNADSGMDVQFKVGQLDGWPVGWGR